MNGTAGIPTTNPGLVYHGLESAAGSGYCRPLMMRNSNATKFTIMNTRLGPAPEPFNSPKGSRKGRSRDVGQTASKEEYEIHHFIQRDDRRRHLPSMFLSGERSEHELFQIRYSGPASMIAAKPSVE